MYPVAATRTNKALGLLYFLPGLSSMHTALDGASLVTGTLLNWAAGWNPDVTGTLTRSGRLIEFDGASYAQDPRGAHADTSAGVAWLGHK